MGKVVQILLFRTVEQAATGLFFWLHFSLNVGVADNNIQKVSVSIDGSAGYMLAPFTTVGLGLPRFINCQNVG